MSLLAKTFREWYARDPFTYSASAAYYAVFSMPGLLMTIIATAALVFDRPRVEDAIVQRLQNIFGADFSDAIHKIIDSVQYSGNSWAAWVGIFTLLFGATGLFVQLQRSLNHIWGIEAKSTANYLDFLRSRATALGVMITIGFLLLVSMTVTAVLTALGEEASFYFPAYAIMLFHFLNLVVSLGIISFLFALMFKVLPDTRLKWRMVLPGGFISAALFIAGEYALTFYFRLAKPQSSFGAAGSIILFMLWISYSCMIFLFGAQFTRIYADERGEAAPPATIARKAES